MEILLVSSNRVENYPEGKSRRRNAKGIGAGAAGAEASASDGDDEQQAVLDVVVEVTTSEPIIWTASVDLEAGDDEGGEDKKGV